MTKTEKMIWKQLGKLDGAIGDECQFYTEKMILKGVSLAIKEYFPNTNFKEAVIEYYKINESHEKSIADNEQAS